MEDNDIYFYDDEIRKHLQEEEDEDEGDYTGDTREEE